MEALAQLPALVLLERIPIPTLAVLRDGTIVFANTARSPTWWAATPTRSFR